MLYTDLERLIKSGELDALDSIASYAATAEFRRFASV